MCSNNRSITCSNMTLSRTAFYSDPCQPLRPFDASRILSTRCNHPQVWECGMKLNHLNLTVSNVLETHRLLEKHFGLKHFGALSPSEAMSFLSDDNGMVLALFGTAKGTELKYPLDFTSAS